MLGGVSGWEEGLGCSVLFSCSPESWRFCGASGGCSDEGQRVDKWGGLSPLPELLYFWDLELD